MTVIQLTAWALLLIILLAVLKNTDLTRIVHDKRWQHLVFGATVAISILWLFRVTIFDGIVFHFLWLSALTLVLGFQWAMIGALVALLISTAIGNDSWYMFGLNGVFGVALPIGITYLSYSYAYHKLPKNTLVYIFVCAFVAGLLGCTAKMLTMSGYFLFVGTYNWDIVNGNYAMIVLLIVLQEAIFNGVSMACLVFYKPSWVSTYNEQLYSPK